MREGGRRPVALQRLCDELASAGGQADILAQELEGEPGIRVARYAPGPMRTPLRSRAFPGALPDEAPPPEDATAGLLALLAPR